MQFNKKEKRLKRAKKTRARINQLGVDKLVVHRSNQHIYAQVINSDTSDKVVISASTLDKTVRGTIKSNTGNINSATEVGKLIAQRAKEKGITKVAFDRSGNRYHGRVKALAEAAREAGLEF